jgi:hypothetical protein
MAELKSFQDQDQQSERPHGRLLSGAALEITLATGKVRKLRPEVAGRSDMREGAECLPV